MTDALLSHDNWTADGSGHWARIVRYRLKHPPALKKLIDIARDVERECELA